MQFELVAFGGTMAVGFVVVLAVWWFVCAIGWFHIRPRDVLVGAERQGLLAVVVVVCIGVGIAIDCSSDDIADGDSPLPFKYYWGADEDLKIAALLLVGQPDRWVPTRLGVQVAREKLFASSRPRFLDKAIDLERRIVLAADVKAGDFGFERMYVADSVRSAYYLAKGDVLRVSTYAEELSRIQQRIVFGRSLALAGFLMLVFVGFALLVMWRRLLCWPGLWVLNSMRKIRGEAESRTSAPSVWERVAVVAAYRKLSLKACCRLGLLAMAMLTVGGYVYSEQEEEYNKRVFGYWHAMKLSKFKD